MPVPSRPTWSVPLAHTGIARSEECFYVAAVIRVPGEMPASLVDCSLAESLPKRSAVVTRRSEPAMSRDLAEFGKFSKSDIASWRVFLGQLGNQRHSQSGLSDCSRRYRSVGEPCWTSSEGPGAATSGPYSEKIERPLSSNRVKKSQEKHVISLGS